MRARAKKTPAQICHAEKGTGRSQAADNRAGIRARVGADRKAESPRGKRVPTG